MAKSIIGFHYSIGGNKNGIGAFMEKLNQNGIPFLMKGTDDAGLCFEGASTGSAHGVKNHLIYRVSTAGQANNIQYDVPDYTKSPKAAAEEHFNKTAAKWPQELNKSLVWMEPINEPRAKLSPGDVQFQNMHPVDWLGAFMLEYARIANGQGFKVCGPSFNSGEPEVFSTNEYELPGMIAYLQYCAANPEKAALSVHEYTWIRWSQGESWPNWYPTLWGRVEAAMAAADNAQRSVGINIPRTFQIFVTEWGFAPDNAPRWPECEPHLTAYNEWAARWPQVKGVAAWTLQSGWGDVDHDLQSWFASLADYAVNRNFSSGTQPARTHALFGNTVPGQQPPDGNGGVPGWPPPAEPLASGWGIAQSIERQGPTTAFGGQNLGKVNFPDGINVREQPSQSAAVKGKIPAGTIVRVTGDIQNDYYPIQVSAVLLGGTVDPGTQFAREFISFNSSADLNNMQPGSQFQATWVLRNTGTAAWKGNFRLDYTETPIPENANTALSSLGPNSFTLQEISGQNQVQPNQTVTLTLNFGAPITPRTWASHWQLKSDTGVAIGNPLWIRMVVKGDPVVVPPPPTGSFQPGMNINPDAHALDIERLRGLKWVRWVYKAAAKNRNVDQAFNEQYRNMIQSYANAGMKSLIILNQETVWGNAPWHNGDWQTYAGALAHAAGRIAELCAAFGDNVAYQIWNEEDSHPDNQSAIAVAPNNFATILGPTAAAIRAKHSGAKIIIGGLNSGPDNAVAYAKQVRERLGGSLPVDALAIHPYGRFVHNDPFYEQRFGRLQDALAVWKQNFPNMPLWITEIGVADNNPIGPENYQKIANYMREFFTEVADNHRSRVPVLIWFAWSDLMRNAGITTTDGQMKAHIGDAYQAFVARGAEAATPQEEASPFALEDSFALAEPAPLAAQMSDSVYLRFETTLADYTAVPAGSTFTNRWTYRNTGASTWGSGFTLVYSPQTDDSHPMMPKTSYNFSELLQPSTVAPGKEGTIVMNMTAPEQHGRRYRSRWELRDPGGRRFGYLYAEITVIPGSTAGTSVQVADMAFVADQTIEDDTRMAAGTTFNKQWRVRNSGVRHWGSGFRLVYVEGDLAMAQGIASHVVPQAGRGETVILNVPMIALPARSGQPTTYSSLWRMQDDRGDFFGDPLWVRIISLPSESGLALGPYKNTAGWYSQLDPRWKDDTLGHGQPTIGSWGCLLTCYAMMLTAYGLRFNPAELNNRLKQIGNDGFRGPVVQFIAPTRLLAGLTRHGNLRSNRSPALPWTDWTGEDPIARIDNALAQGHTVIAQVDRNPNDAHYQADTESHWVILVARTADGSDYLILDPMTAASQITDQPRSLMLKYGRRVPSRSNEENLRNAIQSALVYRFNGAVGPG
jgi:hypothetical protein